MKILIFLMLIIFTNCEAQTKLPKEMPANLVIIYTSEGGFSPSLFRAEISGKKLTITKNSVETNHKDVVREVKLSDNEMKNLYQSFVENKFDLIKPNEEIRVPDGKFRSIELKFADKLYYGINGDGIVPPKGHAERFKKIEDEITKIISAHPENNSTK